MTPQHLYRTSFLLLFVAPLLAQRDLYTVHGAKGDQFGMSVSFVGDLDRDGFEDFVVGAIQQNTASTGEGYARVFSGRHARVLFQVKGDAMLDFFGASVSGAGDTDLDGFPDIIVGSQSIFGIQVKGYAKLLSGKDGALLHKFSGDVRGDEFGYSVSGTGDVDGDGYPDVIVGARRGGPVVGIGYARVFSGKDHSVIHTVRGNLIGDRFGCSVSGAGDVDADGHADFIVGARMAVHNSQQTGSAQVFSGKDGKVLHAFYGDAAGDMFGHAVSDAGDIDKDGHADVIVGAVLDDNQGEHSGSARVFSGKAGKILYSFDGDAAGVYFGHSVCGAGDLDKDGFPDLVVGMPGHGKNGPNSGCARAYSGATGKVLFDFYGETANSWVGHSVAGGGDLDADGYPDFLVGLPFVGFRGVNSGSARAYSGIPQLAYDVYGQGCAGSSLVLPRIRALDVPRVGKAFSVEVRDLRPARLGLLLFGVSDKTWQGTPLPLELGFFGMPGCHLLVSWDLQYPVWSGDGILTHSVTLPDNAAALGFEFYTQCWVLAEGANPRGIATSNAGYGIIRKAN